MRPENSHGSNTPPKPSQAPQPISLRFMGMDWKLRPSVMSFVHTNASGSVFSACSPYAVIQQKIAKQAELRKKAEEAQHKATLQILEQTARDHGTSTAYGLIMATLVRNYKQVAGKSWMGEKIANHSMSMMETFKKGGPTLPGFSLALSEQAKKLIPAPLPKDATVLQRWSHHLQSVKGYTRAHDEAYKDTHIDRHFTPWWLTGAVLMGKGMVDMVPAYAHAPVNALYGQFTGNMALTFNPAQTYDTSDFTKRSLLYAGLSGLAYHQAIPRLFFASAKSGDIRVRLYCFATSILTGTGYEFYCGYKAGTGYMKRAISHVTIVEKDD
jgi:hypothetical protein